MTATSKQHCSPLQQWHYDAVIDVFAVHNVTVTQNAFQWAGQPPKLPLSLLDMGPI